MPIHIHLHKNNAHTHTCSTHAQCPYTYTFYTRTMPIHIHVLHTNNAHTHTRVHSYIHTQTSYCNIYASTAPLSSELSVDSALTLGFSVSSASRSHSIAVCTAGYQISLLRAFLPQHRPRGVCSSAPPVTEGPLIARSLNRQEINFCVRSTPPCGGSYDGNHVS